MLFVTRAYRWLRDTVSQATGMGITNNIIDYYAALLRMWQPGIVSFSLASVEALTLFVAADFIFDFDRRRPVSRYSSSANGAASRYFR